MMTTFEYRVRNELKTFLYQQGYRSYALLLDYFDLNLTKDPDVVAYMIPEKGIIVVNEGLLQDRDELSFAVRHEILHEFLDHLLRMQKHKPGGFNQRVSNYAGDWEISNLGYTDRDKRLAKHFRLNGQTLELLVTDVDHPEWVNLTLEQMYDELEKEMKEQKDELEDDLQDPYSPEFKDGWNDFVEMFNNDEITDEELDELKKQFQGGKE